MRAGWVLLAFLIFLALFSARKRLAMLPLGSAYAWRLLHETGGLVALALFWLHTRTLWPKGFYEQILAGFFYAVSFSGCAGSLLQRIYPPRLTQTGVEIIYERIPAELEQLRSQAAALAVPQEAGFHWFFKRPRFFFSHLLGSKKSERWVRAHFTDAKLQACALLKNKIDTHYAVQSVLKGWLFLHVPLTAGLLVLVLWHVLLVHIYLL